MFGQDLRTRVERGRMLAQQVGDPSLRCALLALMKDIDRELALLAPPAVEPQRLEHPLQRC